MAYKTDAGGQAIKCNDIKLFWGAGASTWATKLSQLSRQRGVVRAITYSLPDMQYVITQLARRPHDILLVANSKFLVRAREIKATFPEIRIATHAATHAKLLLLGPDTVYLTSANFGKSGWFEAAIWLHSPEAYSWYCAGFDAFWKECQEVLLK